MRQIVAQKKVGLSGLTDRPTLCKLFAFQYSFFANTLSTRKGIEFPKFYWVQFQWYVKMYVHHRLTEHESSLHLAFSPTM